MNKNSHFKNKDLVNKLINEIKLKSNGHVYRIMEICGTHTMSISRSGLRSILPNSIDLVSGPGCPVCVTSQSEIDLFFDLIGKGVTVVTFGDLLRIPGSSGETLADFRAKGADIRVVYSPIDTIGLAQVERNKEFVFLGVGFETTAPIVGHLIIEAKAKSIENISLLSLCKTMPKAIELILSDNDLNLSGFLCPGHVTTVTGLSLYEPIIKSGKSAVITGFEPVEILSSILEIISQNKNCNFYVDNKYRRVVKDEGNEIARDIINNVFKPQSVLWRGLGELEDSGLCISDKYAEYDAVKKYNLTIYPYSEIKGCRCGDVLKGKMKPFSCKLFGKVCTPSKPYGPCMVSSEGTCGAYYKFG